MDDEIIVGSNQTGDVIDWQKSMQQTYEFYKVDPNTWKDSELITNVESCSIDRDESSETLGSASIDCAEDLSECYIRVYLSIIQNGIKHKEPLGTFMVQTPSIGFDGKRKDISMDAYTPLIELKEKSPAVGYSLMENQDIMSIAYMLCRENMRAPVVEANSTKKLYSDFVSNLDDTWLSFIKDLVANAKFQISMDALGKVMFDPIKDIGSLQPVWVYNDDNSSILYPDITDDRDLYGVPNVVEVVYSTSSGYLISRVVNDDPGSPISTVNRGREVLYRDSNPSISGQPTQEYLDEYATQLLRNLSCLEHTISYKHGYCPVRVGDCVLLNYERAGMHYIRAKVISQSIRCETGCPVEEKAVYTEKLWR